MYSRTLSAIVARTTVVHTCFRATSALCLVLDSQPGYAAAPPRYASTLVEL